jgi:hypothetical protein
LKAAGVGWEDEFVDLLLSGIQIAEPDLGVHGDDVAGQRLRLDHLRTVQFFLQRLEVFELRRAPFARALDELP